MAFFNQKQTKTFHLDANFSALYIVSKYLFLMSAKTDSRPTLNDNHFLTARLNSPEVAESSESLYPMRAHQTRMDKA